MTCDLSDAEHVGFELAVREHYGINESDSLALESHYRFCEVHFKRSLTRVRRNGGIVRPDKEMDFYSQALDLLNSNHSQESFQNLIREFETEYPKIKKWLALVFAPF